jgi:hypothetical protein
MRASLRVLKLGRYKEAHVQAWGAHTRLASWHGAPTHHLPLIGVWSNDDLWHLIPLQCYDMSMQPHARAGSRRGTPTLRFISPHARTMYRHGAPTYHLPLTGVWSAMTCVILSHSNVMICLCNPHARTTSSCEAPSSGPSPPHARTTSRCGAPTHHLPLIQQWPVSHYPTLMMWYAYATSTLGRCKGGWDQYFEFKNERYNTKYKNILYFATNYSITLFIYIKRRNFKYVIID